MSGSIAHFVVYIIYDVSMGSCVGWYCIFTLPVLYLSDVGHRVDCLCATQPVLYLSISQLNVSRST
jgi:hypothetical protein